MLHQTPTTMYKTPFKPPYFCSLAAPSSVKFTKPPSQLNVCSLQRPWASLGWSLNSDDSNCWWIGRRQTERRQNTKGLRRRNRKNGLCNSSMSNYILYEGKFARNRAIVSGQLEKPDIHLCVWFLLKPLFCRGNWYSGVSTRKEKDRHH